MTQAIISPKSKLWQPLITLYTRISQNPVVLKELRSRMRGGKTFWAITSYLGILSLVVGMIYTSMVALDSSMGMYSGYSNNTSIRSEIGSAIFSTVLTLQFFFVIMTAPTLTSNAITAERENQTFDLLRTTLLSAKSLAGGKIYAAMFFIILLLMAALPVQSIALLFGGVEFPELMIVTLVMMATALLLCNMGVFFSSLVKRTAVANGLSTGFSVFFIFMAPVLFSFFFGISVSRLMGYSNYAASGSDPSPAFLYLLGVLFWILVSLNPISALLASQIILVEEQSYFFAKIPIDKGVDFFVISPWISCVVFYMVLSYFVFRMSVNLIKQKEK
ncbi:MAG: hypothetical protein OEZ02_05925 [Anaerolineae bacterium]|nr:hypothetical protein [Anaerolineae bacterium]